MVGGIVFLPLPVLGGAALSAVIIGAGASGSASGCVCAKPTLPKRLHAAKPTTADVTQSRPRTHVSDGTGGLFLMVTIRRQRRRLSIRLATALRRSSEHGKGEEHDHRRYERGLQEPCWRDAVVEMLVEDRLTRRVRGVCDGGQAFSPRYPISTVPSSYTLIGSPVLTASRNLSPSRSIVTMRLSIHMSAINRPPSASEST